MPLIFPDSPTPGQQATINGRQWEWDGYRWVQSYTGYTGSLGYTGSQGNLGYTGSFGYLGSTGFTGSQGAGFTGSQGSSFDLGINYAYRAILM